MINEYTEKEQSKMGYTGYIDDMPVLYITENGMDELRKVVAQSVTPELWELKDEDSNIFGWFKNNDESPNAHRVKLRRSVEKLKSQYKIKESIISFVFTNANVGMIRLKPGDCKDIYNVIQDHNDQYCYGDPQDLPTTIEDIKSCLNDAVESHSVLKFERI